MGGGASRLVDCLLDAEYSHLTVVDVSEASLQVAQARLGERAAGVTWLMADVRRLRLPEEVDVWHDRAVFHFLTEEADRQAYRGAVLAALRVGGYVVIATFGPSGPQQCSGLDICRYDAKALASFFGLEFELVRSIEKEHVTPWGGAQQFTYATIRRLR